MEGESELGSAPAAAAAASSPAEREKVARYLAGLRREQRFGRGLLAGLLAALLAGGLWAGITLALGIQFGWLALPAGALVGLAVRRFGRGLELRFGLLAAGLALLGCLLADLLAAYLLAGQQFGLSAGEVVALIRFEVMRDLLLGTVGVLDAVFHGVAVIAAYNLSFRRVAPAELARVATG